MLLLTVVGETILPDQDFVHWTFHSCRDFVHWSFHN